MPAARSEGERVRTVALAVVRRRSDGALLLGIGTDPATKRQFCRPVGGGIEDGETPEQAVRREWVEEVGVELGDARPLAVLDNRFTYAGRPGREVTHLFEAVLRDASLESRGEFPVAKKSLPKIARWFLPEHLGPGRARLVPEGLLARLRPRLPKGGPIRCVAIVRSRAKESPWKSVGWVAASGGRLGEVAHGRSSAETIDRLVAEAARDPALVAGVEGLHRRPDRARLREAGFALWPGDGARLPLAIGIEPRAFAAGAGDPRSGAEILLEHLAGGPAETLRRIASSKAMGAAALAALAMDRHLAELLSLPPAAKRNGRGAGRIWSPWRES